MTSEVINARSRFERLATGILVVVVAYGVAISKILDAPASFSIPLQWLVTLLSSGALYGMLIRASLSLINRSDRLLSLYWGSNLFWRGLWHYTSEYDGKLYLGVWRIDQDALSIRVRAFGLDEHYSRRFTAFSITDVVEAAGQSGVYEVINARNDYDDCEIGDLIVYSKTRLVPESPVKFAAFCRGPAVMRGETIIYGGTRSGLMNRNVVLRKHLDATSEDAVIEHLKELGLRHGAPLGMAPVA